MICSLGSKCLRELKALSFTAYQCVQALTSAHIHVRQQCCHLQFQSTQYNHAFAYTARSASIDSQTKNRVYQTKVWISSLQQCHLLHSIVPHDKINYCHHRRHQSLVHVVLQSCRRMWERTIYDRNGCRNGCFSITACCNGLPPSTASGKHLRSSDFIEINDVFYTTPFTFNSLHTHKEFFFLKNRSIPLLCMFFSPKPSCTRSPTKKGIAV